MTQDEKLDFFASTPEGKKLLQMLHDGREELLSKVGPPAEGKAWSIEVSVEDEDGGECEITLTAVEVDIVDLGEPSDIKDE